MKEQSNSRNDKKSVQKLTIQQNSKDVEVKSIKIVQTDVNKTDINTDKRPANADKNTANAGSIESRKMNFNLADKQKEEIRIRLSSESLEKIKLEQRRKASEERAREQARLKAAEERAKKQARLRAAANNRARAQEASNRKKANATTRSAAGSKEVGDIKTYSTEFMILNVGVILITVIALTVSLIFLKRSSGFSESENRELYSFPSFSIESLLNGEYTSSITSYFTDTVPNREKLKELTKGFTNFLGVSPNKASVINAGTTVNDEKFQGTINTPDITIYTGTRPSGDSTGSDPSSSDDEPAVTTTPSPITDDSSESKRPNGGVDEIKNGLLVINKGTSDVRAMELYGGGFAVGKNYANSLNKYKKDLGQYVNVYNMSIPMAVAYYLPSEFKDQSASVPDNINNIVSHLKNIVNVDAYSAIKPHTNEYIYSRTDHHWQPLAAYYAAREFAKQAQVDFADLSSYEKLVKKDYVGTLYGSSGEAQLNKYPDTFTYYKPANKYDTYYYNTNFTGKEKSSLFFDWASGVNTYSVFLGKDNVVTQIDTDVKNGRTLVIYKDSFGNAIVPFLVGSFEHIYVCDYRFSDFNAVEFCNEVGATDLLFATSLFTNTTQSKVDKIEDNRTR